MSTNNEWRAPEEEEDLEDDTFLSLTRDTVLFCIDASESMSSVASGTGESRTHLHQALQCAFDVMKRKAIISPGDSVGIVLFNTAKTQGEQEVDHTFVLLPVGPINADSILAVGEILDKGEKNSRKITELFPPWEERVSIGDVFAACNHVLRSGAPKTSIKRIFYITNEDDPGSVVGPTAKRLEDLVTQGITLVPFFISTDDKPFNPHRFYSGAFAQAGADDEDTAPFDTVCQGFEQVIAEMKIREMPKRAVWSIPMEISDGLTIGIKGYGLVTEQKKPAYKKVSVGGSTTEEVVARTVFFDKDQHTKIEDVEVLYGLPSTTGNEPFKRELDTGDNAPRTVIKGEDGEDVFLDIKPPESVRQALLTSKQVRSLRTLGLSPGIKILGFQDRSELQFEDNIKHAYFLYPDEGRYTGSTRTFSALLKSLAKMDKMGICRVTMRINSSPVFCALIPQEEELDQDGVQITPPGMHLIPMPFADEIRDPPITEAHKASDDLVQATIPILKKLILKRGYQPDAFLNPALARHFHWIEANALGTEFDPDTLIDHTLPNYSQISSKLGPAINHWREVLDEEPAAQLVGKASRKRAAKDATDTAYDETEIRSRYDAGNLSKLTVAQMKDFLRSKAQTFSSKAKKDELIEKLAEYLEAHPA